MEETLVLKINTPVRHNMVKRGFDLCFSLAALAVLSPLLLIIAVAVKSTSSGPVIYGHKRVGRGGVFFKCLKFRTMHRDADERLQRLLTAHPELKKEWERSHKLKNDPRVTKIGDFLRRTSLDEFPQFWNVLRGDLSVVGPRPVVEEEIHKHIGKKAHKILSIRPGITGLWQTSGRSNLSYKKRIALDEHYVENRNILLDIKLVLKTIPCLISSKDAY